ncbi:TetR/AcrR family transcriptional regulator [Carboxylicivirga linearis]|uniref:TetR/AcrR family transcriptional regulator n=1 Tax=Carboxylicivirga linearis TaxID=1628157 RepID=A0ABS5JPB7_9BACT|nr:TetR/AcrR family transcriptional regulator [Carboxylicivirga linearis]MBS2096741.1 TetR/AcrR family transcriptional regulator [Carboxylicivirga linearis]
MKDKRQQIIKQSALLFHQYGIKSVSMDDIARELGMSKKTLYHFIKDKNDLVESVVEFNLQLYSDFLSAFHDLKSNAIEQFYLYTSKIKEHFPKYNPSMLYDLRKYYPLLLNTILDKRQKLIYNATYANLEKGKKEGFYQPDIQSDIISKLQVANQNYTMDPSNGLFTDAELGDHKVLEQLFKYHFRGICTPEGIKELKRVFNFK